MKQKHKQETSLADVQLFYMTNCCLGSMACRIREFSNCLGSQMYKDHRASTHRRGEVCCNHVWAVANFITVTSGRTGVAHVSAGVKPLADVSQGRGAPSPGEQLPEAAIPCLVCWLYFLEGCGRWAACHHKAEPEH